MERMVGMGNLNSPCKGEWIAGVRLKTSDRSNYEYVAQGFLL
jgi:hypothetical protein